MGRLPPEAIVTEPGFREFMSGLCAQSDDAPKAGCSHNEAGRDLFIIRSDCERFARGACSPACLHWGPALQVIERRRLAALMVGGAIAGSSLALSLFVAHGSVPYVLGTGALGMVAAFAVARG